MYGFLISISILISLLLSERVVKRDDKNTHVLWDLASVIIIWGVLGARFYYVVTNWHYYENNLVEILYIWHGGLGIYGAILFGFIAAYIYLKNKKLDTWYYISIITIYLPLSQAIGRWGNYFNKELYGIQTTLPWGINLEGVKYHPLFLYESILNLILFIILINFKNDTHIKPQKIIGIYLGGYGLIRFFMEVLKINSWSFSNLTSAQLVSLIFLIISYILIKDISIKKLVISKKGSVQ